MLRRQPKTLAELSTKTWNSEIGFSGYDPVEKTVNGMKVSYDPAKAQVIDALGHIFEDRDHKKARKYRNSIRRQVADFFFGNFLGMRNDTRAQDVGRTMIKNMLWIPEAGAPTAQRVIQIIGMVIGLVTGITLAYVLYSLARNIVMNTAKVLLKFVPQLAVNWFSELQKRIDDRIANENPGALLQFGLEFAHVLLSIVKAPFQAIEFVGGAILSPIDNFRMANKKGGFWLAALSVAVSAIAYLILLPIVSAVVAKQVPAFFSDTVSPFFANKVAPWLAAHKMRWLVTAANKVGGFFEPAVTWVGSAISKAYTDVSGWISKALTWMWNSTVGTDPLSTINLMTNFAVSKASALTGLDLSAKLAGFGAVLGVVGSAVAAPFVRLYQFVANKFVNNTPAPVVPAVAGRAPVAVPRAVTPADLMRQLAQDRRNSANRNDATDARINGVLARFDAIDVHSNAVDARLDARDDAVDNRLDALAQNLGREAAVIDALNAELHPDGQPALVAQVAVAGRIAEQADGKADAADAKADAADARIVSFQKDVIDTAASIASVKAVEKTVTDVSGRVDVLAHGQAAMLARLGALPAPVAVPPEAPVVVVPDPAAPKGPGATL